MNETKLTAAILETWPMEVTLPRYITAIQVHNAAGYGYSRKLDAIVFDTWPSGDLLVHGLEIKCTKADLRRELQNTKKFSDFSPHLDLFSIVAPKGIADLKLLPPKWGLYCPTDDGKLRARRRPLMLHTDGQRREASLSFMAAFVRALVVRSISDDGKKAEFARGEAYGERTMKEEVESLTREVAKYKQAIETFEEASGVTIVSWNAGTIGEAVEVVLSGKIMRRIQYSPNIRNMGEKLIKLADELDALQERFDGT
jgi:hypothetical protein